MAAGGRFKFADLQNLLFLHPSDGPLSSSVSKLQGAADYQTWKRSFEIQLSSKRKLGFVYGTVVRSCTDDAEAIQWETCNNLKWCVWRQPENLVFASWSKSASFRYNDLRCRARAKWESTGRMDNKIGKNVWLSWIEEWKTPEVQAKSKIKRRNRRGGADKGNYPPTHTGGSASHRIVATRLDNLDPTKLFMYTHTKNHDNETFIDNKSAAIFKTLKTLRAERYQPVDGSLVPQLVDEVKLYLEAVGGRNKRNRIYGIGSSQNIFYKPSNEISCYNRSQPNTQDYQKLEAELKEMKDEIKEMDEVKQRLREMERR